jgi:serine/threonine protein phosphatase PrpC
MIINKQIIKKDIKICSCTKAGLSCPGIVKSNQDSFFIQENFMSNLDYFFIGVCDGHGQDGQKISNIVANKLPNYITSLSNEEIISNFKKINSEIYSDSDINSNMSGTTVVSLIITPDKLISINL